MWTGSNHQTDVKDPSVCDHVCADHQPVCGEALRNGDEDVAMMREEYNGRRRYVLERFKEMGLSCFEPFGAFYAFPCIKDLGMTSDEFATKLLQTKKVAVVPGTAFGACGEGFLRISYAYSLDDLRIALDRVAEFVTEIREIKN